MTAPKLTKFQQQTIRRMREANVECPEIATALDLDVMAVRGYVANQKNMKAMAEARSIAKLVTVRDPEAYMRRRGVWYGRMPLDQSP